AVSRARHRPDVGVSYRPWLPLLSPHAIAQQVSLPMTYKRFVIPQSEREFLSSCGTNGARVSRAYVSSGSGWPIEERAEESRRRGSRLEPDPPCYEHERERDCRCQRDARPKACAAGWAMRLTRPHRRGHP